MFRLSTYSISAALLLAATSTLSAQAPAGGAPPAAAATGRDVAVFNMGKVQKDFLKWDALIKQMQNVQVNQAKGLAELRTQILEIQNKLQNPTEPQKEMLEKQLVALQRQFQDKDAEVRKALEKISTDSLAVLHDDIRRVVDAVAKANGFGLVMAYPDATTEEQRKTAMYFDMKLRPGAAMPWYIGPGNDITDVVIKTLNMHCPPPPGTAVTPAGATAPAAPPAAGTPGTPRP